MIDRQRFIAASAAVAVAVPTIVRAQPALGTLRIGGSPNDDMTPVVYGKQAGIFSKYGLDVDIQKTSSGSAAAAAVAGRTFDIAKSSITTIFAAHDKGVPFSILTPAALYDNREPAGGFLIAKDSPLKTGADYNGQTFGVASLESLGRPALAKWVDLHGGDASSLKFVELPFPQVPAAIEQGRVAGGETAPPMQSEALATGKFTFVPAYGAIAPVYVAAVYYTLRDTSRERPDAIKAFVKAFYEAVRFTNTHHPATAPLMAQFTGIPLSDYLKLERIQAGPELKLAQIQPTIDASAKYGTLQHDFPAQDIIDVNAVVS